MGTTVLGGFFEGKDVRVADRFEDGDKDGACVGEIV